MTNYTLIKEEYIDQIQSKVSIYSHNKTKARVCTIENDDRNKVFSIAFRTAPINSTGLTHILEHSVLCGSKKYPVKDPFVELVKSSLNTFLNAFTFPDKTMYPCASQNDKDFKNIMSVYMDAVFYPRIHDFEEIFLQEGWRYDIKDPNDDIKINGVVYNEMKGAFSDPQQVLYRMIMHSLFPDTPYGFESGGDPKYIPDLSYEQFKKFHRDFYHPSNSYIFVYGDCDMKERLEWMDKEYLSHFEYNPFDTRIPYQNTFDKPHYVLDYYQVDEASSLDDKSFISYNIALPDSKNMKLMLALGILTTVILDNPGAPLKQAILDNEIGDSVDSMFDDGLIQPIFSVIVSNAKKDSINKLIELVESELRKYANEGLDHEALLSLINYQEFKSREGLFGRYPKGLSIEMTMLNSWLYDEDDAWSKVNDLPYYDELRRSVDEGYFEQIIKDYLLNTNHKAYITLAPSYDANKKEEEALKNKLKEFKKSLSSDELDSLIKKNERLNEYQNSLETKEALDTLPKLELEDLPLEPEKLNLEIFDNKYKSLVSEYYTNGICYVKYFFNIDHIGKEDAQYLALASTLLSLMSTKNRDYKNLNNEIQNNTGAVSFLTTPYHDKNNESRFQFVCYFSALGNKLNDANELVSDILFNTIFNDYKRLKELINEQAVNLEMGVSGKGHVVALTRALAGVDEGNYLADLTSGIGYLDFIKDVANNFDSKKEEIVAKLNDSIKKILSKERFTLGFVGQRDFYEANLNVFDKFYSSLSDNIVNLEESYTPFRVSEGIVAPYNVNYVSRAGKTDIPFNGANFVLNNALGMDYLWNEVRVHGGAYGCMVRATRYGTIGFTSYRDPEVKKTNETYEKVIDYIKNFNFNDEELLKFKIGAIGSLDSVLHPSNKGFQAQSLYFQGITYLDECKYRKELISATNDDIKALSKNYQEMLSYNNICVIGNKDKIEVFKDSLDNIRPLVK